MLLRIPPNEVKRSSGDYVSSLRNQACIQVLSKTTSINGGFNRPCCHPLSSRMCCETTNTLQCSEIKSFGEAIKGFGLSP